MAGCKFHRIIPQFMCQAWAAAMCLFTSKYEEGDVVLSQVKPHREGGDFTKGGRRVLICRTW